MMAPPNLKPPAELRRAGAPEWAIRLSEEQHAEWAAAPHCCGARGFDAAEHRCPGCERERGGPVCR